MWQLRLYRHQNQCGYFTDKYDAGVSLACLGDGEGTYLVKHLTTVGSVWSVDQQH